MDLVRLYCSGELFIWVAFFVPLFACVVKVCLNGHLPEMKDIKAFFKKHMLTIAIGLIGMLVAIASFYGNSYTWLTGQLIAHSHYATENGQVIQGGNSLLFTVTIQNPSNNPVSVYKVVLEIDGNEEVELYSSAGSPVQSDDARSSTASSVLGTAVEVGGAVSLSLRLEDSKKEAIEGKALTGCYALSTTGKKYYLEIMPTLSSTSDTVVNHFTLAS